MSQPPDSATVLADVRRALAEDFGSGDVTADLLPPQAQAHARVIAREAAVVGERNRIARDIHDTLAQGFTGIIVQLEAAEDAARRGLGLAVEQHVTSARRLARQSLSEARRSVQALRTRLLEEGDIVHALRALFDKATDGVSLAGDFRVLGEPRALPADWEENLFRIAQECLTNALRHAHASRVDATISFDIDQVWLQVDDDGQGFDPQARSEGYGLIGMRERVGVMGGQIEVETALGRGTRVAVHLPLSLIPSLASNG